MVKCTHINLKAAQKVPFQLSKRLNSESAHVINEAALKASEKSVLNTELMYCANKILMGHIFINTSFMAFDFTKAWSLGLCAES